MSRTNFETAEIESWPEGTKKCWGCKKLKALGAFHVMKQGLLGVNTYCKECRKPKSRNHWAGMSYKVKMFDRTKGRAKHKGREFTITIDDFEIPDECPVFKRPFEYEANSPWVPSIDRIDSSVGYVPGNVQVISWRANTLKNNMTAEEARLMADFLNS